MAVNQNDVMKMYGDVIKIIPDLECVDSASGLKISIGDRVVLSSTGGGSQVNINLAFACLSGMKEACLALKTKTK